MNDRTLGWVQDPGKLQTLRVVVSLFSARHNPTLLPTITSNLQLPAPGKQALISRLSNTQTAVTLTFKELIGSKGKVNGLMQAVLQGQRGGAMSTWACDNFLRWAHALGYLSYDRARDTFTITPEGDALLGTAKDSQAEKALNTAALMSYPPVRRILLLLDEAGVGRTKWELGAELGFVGEDGFTNYSPQRIYDWIATADADEARDVRVNVEGTSDKYARMVCGWLESVGLVTKVELARTATSGTRIENLTGFTLTGAGQRAVSRLRGRGGNAKPAQRVSWEMLATKPKGDTRMWRRNVRAEILLELMVANKSGRTTHALAILLAGKGLVTPDKAIVDHVQGLQRIGIDIEADGDKWVLHSSVVGLNIPSYGAAVVPPDVQLDNKLRATVQHLDHKYLVLTQLAFGGKNEAAELERVTAELLIDELGMPGVALGGPHKPDGAVWDETRTVLIDTKAYAGGYGSSVDDHRAVASYVRAVSRRQGAGTAWWDPIPAESSDRFGFCFISGSFRPTASGNAQAVKNELDDVDAAKTVGLNLTVENLLLVADDLRRRRAGASECLDELFFANAA
jgi:hypothetical protein